MNELVFSEEEINLILKELPDHIFICHACENCGIKKDKVRALADYAFEEGIIEKWNCREDRAFYFIETKFNFRKERILLLEAYRKHLYG
jgi:hypothetical protein